MKVELTNLSEGACNFCDKGKINVNQNGLVYPYDKVYTFVKDGNGIKPRMCDECLDELKEKIRELRITEITERLKQNS